MARQDIARSTIEMNDPSSRPEIEAIRDNMAEYDVIFLEFPKVKDATPQIHAYTLLAIKVEANCLLESLQ